MHRLGVQGHSLRYAFARERVEAYLQNGMPMAEASHAPAWIWDTVMGVGGGSRWFICGDGLLGIIDTFIAAHQ
ncbi:hypothetical protein OS187_07730 [Xanthomonadaceae bacterium JHOS43]|nr:hypothetical protein [Xanthomonadaceae bacterium JHOS43]